MSQPQIHNGYYYTQQADGSWRRGQPVAQQMPANPTFDLERPKALAETAQAQAQAQVATAEAPYAPAIAAATAQKTQAEAVKTGFEADAVVQQARKWEDTQERKAMRESLKTDSMLRAIRNARKIAQEDGGTGWSSLLSGVPTTSARRLQSELAPVFANLGFDRLQQMRDESATGGAVGSLTDRELDVLASTVASLDTGVDLNTFLDRLDTIERHFIGMQLNALGVDPTSDEGRKAFKDEYGYTGVFDGEQARDRMGLGDVSATQTRDQIPDEYQQAHLRYLRDNWGNLDPDAYVRFRTGLDETFGLTPDLNAYAAAVPRFNEAAAQQVAPEQLGNVPAPTRGMGALEQGLNYAAQSAPGAAFANATNAFAGGLPAAIGGGQDQLELLREARPYSSMGGEVVGSGLGALALGAGAGLAGGGRLASTLSKPFMSEMGHSAIYGATQDSDPLRGAAFGAVGSAAGSAIGRQIGRAMPETFAPGAVRDADERVSTSEQLREQASDLYANVEAQGVAAGPEATAEMMERARTILAGQGRIGGDGRAIISDGPTKQAYELLESFSAGGTMAPRQAQTVRETLGEGLTSNVPKERRIASMLLEDFDDWSGPVMPGAEEAREVSSRYIRGQQLSGLTDRAVARGERLRGSDPAAQVRTLYGQLDERVGQGQAFFDPATAAKISEVAQGDRFGNAMRWVGKFSPQNVMPALSQGSGAVASAATGNPIPALAAGAVAGAGLFGRKLSNDRTMRAAREAELTALGGAEYQKLLETARQFAATNAGRGLGGASGGLASTMTR
jgi:hypothetical protein